MARGERKIYKPDLLPFFDRPAPNLETRPRSPFSRLFDEVFKMLRTAPSVPTTALESPYVSHGLKRLPCSAMRYPTSPNIRSLPRSLNEHRAFGAVW